MVEIVKVVPNGKETLEQGALKTVMTSRGRKCRELRVEEKVNRMRGNYEVYENDAQVEQMFNWMHGHT